MRDEIRSEEEELIAEEIKYLDEKQLRKFFTAIKSKTVIRERYVRGAGGEKNVFEVKNRERTRDECLFHLMYSFGMRAGEVTQLRVDDLDFERQEIKILRLKKAKRRLYPHKLDGESSWLVKKWLRERKKRKIISPYLFTSQKGGRMSQNRLYALTRDYGRSCGLDWVHPHCFRHSCAYMILRDGGSIIDVMDRLNHSSITSSQIYCQLFGEERKKRERQTEIALSNF